MLSTMEKMPKPGASPVIRGTVTGEPTTDLSSIISDLPWEDSFVFGSGVDAITGGTLGSAINPFTPTQRTTKTSLENCRFIQSERELNREIETSASGKYNIEGITITASASYLSKIKFSELFITLVAQYQSEYNGYDEASTYTLTDAARKHIQEPAQFRNMYGDYFVAGGKRGSRFTAVYTCSTTTAEKMDEFKASFGGEAPEVFSAEGSARFLQSAKEHNVSLSVNLFMEGYTGTPPSGPWTPEKILQALEWFKQNEQGIYLKAKLEHYSVIDPTYPRTINIAPGIFVDLRQLYLTVWDVRSRYSTCPEVYQAQLKKDYIDLDAGVTAHQNILAVDTDKRLEYQTKADRLLSQLNDVFSRMDFYFKVQQTISTEPAKGQVIEEGRGQQSWMYGYSTYTKSPAVVIASTEMRYHEDWHIGWREHTFEFGPDQNRLIVGWQVISNWNDGTNGSWKKVVDSILSTSYAAVYVTSLYDRGCDWSLRIYHVDAKDYQFGLKADVFTKVLSEVF
ncbi:hypothetical protein [Dictyobacter formicarum]|uniref:MACPF domain-containing protein n=1 Tax=Dictyobacter formicarum TaxID=2778368 RepID=A0ABQ3VF66_9CHLR|nr:hypothetical protein [Dictyobacter formicarum]GHO84131.1 hypothetical protein KSZ_21370 [Dictyobacter formicarum]